MEGPLDAANHEIRDAEIEAVQGRVARLSEPRRLTDQLLYRLEELNLDGVGTIPDGFEAILADLRGQLSRQAGVDHRLLDRLRPGSKTADAIETIFTIQEVIAPPTLEPDEFPFEEPI